MWQIFRWVNIFHSWYCLKCIATFYIQDVLVFGTDSNYESSFWVPCGTSIATCVSDFIWAIKTKGKLEELCYRTGNIYRWLQTLWCSQVQKNNYISHFIISNIFLYQHNFVCISVGSQKQNIWIQLEEWFLRGWMCVFDIGNGNWCMLGRALLCRTGRFCVKPCIFVSNLAFFSQTRLFVSNRCSYP